MQYTHSSSVMPTSPAFQYRAFVGHFSMQILHSMPWHVRLFIVIVPSMKNSLMPNGSRSSFLRFFFSIWIVSVSSSKMFIELFSSDFSDILFRF